MFRFKVIVCGGVELECILLNECCFLTCDSLSVICQSWQVYVIVLEYLEKERESSTFTNTIELSECRNLLSHNLELPET